MRSQTSSSCIRSIFASASATHAESFSWSRTSWLSGDSASHRSRSRRSGPDSSSSRSTFRINPLISFTIDGLYHAISRHRTGLKADDEGKTGDGGFHPKEERTFFKLFLGLSLVGAEDRRQQKKGA